MSKVKESKIAKELLIILQKSKLFKLIESIVVMNFSLKSKEKLESTW
jgi:hypothetical protein